MRGWMRTGILCGALGLSGALLPAQRGCPDAGPLHSRQRRRHALDDRTRLVAHDASTKS